MPTKTAFTPKTAVTGRPVIYENDLQPWKDRVPVEDVVAQFNRTRDSQLDEFDAYMRDYFRRQHGIMRGRELSAREIVRTQFVDGLEWAPVAGSGTGALKMASGRRTVQRVRTATLGKMRAWKRATKKELLGSLVADLDLDTVHRIPGNYKDPLTKAIQGMTREHFMELAETIPDEGVELWKSRARIRRDLDILTVDDYTHGQVSNVLAAVDLTHRHVREKVISFSARGARKKPVTKWAGEIRTNLNTFKLSTTAHGLGLYRYSTTQVFPEGEFMYRLDAPRSRLANINPFGAIAGGLFRILTGQQWEKYTRSYQAGRAEQSGGIDDLGFHHNDFSMPTPIPVADDELLDAFMADARERRREFKEWIENEKARAAKKGKGRKRRKR